MEHRLHASPPGHASLPPEKPEKRSPASRFARLPVTACAILSCLPAASAGTLTIASSASNDLFRAASQSGMELKRFDSPHAAVEAAADGSAVLLLADGYPAQTTALDASLFRKAAGKKLRLYVEYPSFLPGLDVGVPRGTLWERAVFASDAFAPELSRLRILAIHGCRFVPLKAKNPHIVMGRVAGFDTAVYGLAKESFPILFELPGREGGGDVLVATTKLSNFATGRYAPGDAWRSIWNYVFAWLQPGMKPAGLEWKPDVRPGFGAAERLPGDAEKQALRRGIDWYFKSCMVIHPSMMAKYNQPANNPDTLPAGPDLKFDDDGRSPHRPRASSLRADRLERLSTILRPGFDGRLCGVLRRRQCALHAGNDARRRSSED